MPQSLRSILGKSNRVRKPSRPSTPSRQNSSSSSPRKATEGQNKTQPRASGSRGKGKGRKGGDDDDLAFGEKLDDRGVAKLVAEELSLRDAIQAMRHIRQRMFSTVPERGLHSTRTAELLNYRVATPPIVTAGHLHAVLASPSRVEREVAELVGKGVLRRVRVMRRGGAGEALIESADLERLVNDTALVSDAAKAKFLGFLRENPTAQAVPLSASGGRIDSKNDSLSPDHADELIRAGFLTSPSTSGSGPLHIRPEDRTTLMSLQRVSQYASGSVSAVGGPNAVHLAGGGGGAPSITHATSPSSAAPSLRLAVPGHGRYLKLAEAAVDWLRDALARTQWGECPEAWLKERFEGGGLYGTRWKEFWGVEWDWVLGEAVGLGVIELFETGSVGKGIRALGS